MYTKRNIILFCSILSLLTSCIKNHTPSSSVRLVNSDHSGLVKEFSEIVKLVAKGGGYHWSCSGTFIDYNIILTAAKCFLDPDTLEPAKEIAYVNAEGKKFVGKAHAWSKYRGDIESGKLSHDLAIIVFDQPIAPKIADIGSAGLSVNLNEKVALVGLGSRSNSYLADMGIRRLGWNRVSSLEGNVLKMEGSILPNLHRDNQGTSSAAEGDTGGAIFNEKRQLVGVISETDRHLGIVTTSAVAIHHGESSWFFQEVMGKLCHSHNR